MFFLGKTGVMLESFVLRCLCLVGLPNDQSAKSAYKMCKTDAANQDKSRSRRRSVPL